MLTPGTANPFPEDAQGADWSATEASPCRSWCSVEYLTSDDRSFRVVRAVDRSSSSTKR